MQDVKTDRNKYIGGSDIPIIMGISPFKKRFDLLLEKAELKENDFEGNAYTEYGNIMEPKIREYVNNYLSRNFVEGKHIYEDIRCHTDGEDETGILEIKTTSDIHETVGEYKNYLVQLLFYMMNTNKKEGTLAVYNRPEDFNEEFDSLRLSIYTIQIDDYVCLCDDIVSAVRQFRIDLEKVKANPLISEDDLIPEELTDLFKEFIKNKDSISSLEARNKEIIEKIEPLVKMTGRKSYEFDNKNVAFVHGSIGTTKIAKEFNADKFKEEHKKLYDKYVEETVKTSKATSNSIRITEKKETNKNE